MAATRRGEGLEVIGHSIGWGGVGDGFRWGVLLRFWSDCRKAGARSCRFGMTRLGERNFYWWTVPLSTLRR